jgi:hypothetical protein
MDKKIVRSRIYITWSEEQSGSQQQLKSHFPAVMSHRQLHLNKLQMSLRTPFSAQVHDCGYALYCIREMRDKSTGISELDTVRYRVIFVLAHTDAWTVLLRHNSIATIIQMQRPQL